MRPPTRYPIIPARRSPGGAGTAAVRVIGIEVPLTMRTPRSPPADVVPIAPGWRAAGRRGRAPPSSRGQVHGRQFGCTAQHRVAAGGIQR